MIATSRIRMAVTLMTEMTSGKSRTISMKETIVKRVKRKATKALLRNHTLKHLIRDSQAINESVKVCLKLSISTSDYQKYLK